MPYALMLTMVRPLEYLARVHFTATRLSHSSPSFGRGTECSIEVPLAVARAVAAVAVVLAVVLVLAARCEDAGSWMRSKPEALSSCEMRELTTCSSTLSPTKATRRAPRSRANAAPHDSGAVTLPAPSSSLPDAATSKKAMIWLVQHPFPRNARSLNLQSGFPRRFCVISTLLACRSSGAFAFAPM